jgi:hypothetical protein
LFPFGKAHASLPAEEEKNPLERRNSRSARNQEETDAEHSARGGRARFQFIALIGTKAMKKKKNSCLVFKETGQSR